jgi:hypothetical protein
MLLFGGSDVLHPLPAQGRADQRGEHDLEGLMK